MLSLHALDRLREDVRAVELTALEGDAPLALEIPHRFADLLVRVHADHGLKIISPPDEAQGSQVSNAGGRKPFESSDRTSTCLDTLRCLGFSADDIFFSATAPIEHPSPSLNGKIQILIVLKKQEREFSITIDFVNGADREKILAEWVKIAEGARDGKFSDGFPEVLERSSIWRTRRRRARRPPTQGSRRAR